ncbi:MAG: glucose-1-phosphate adenylyltransferase family protein [Dehalococcoidia bacterium]
MPPAALNAHARMLDILDRTVALVLAGGHGKRLRPLTERRAKPALHFGGTYRVIDFTLSNCVNSGLTRVGVLTQYLPHELHQHLGGGAPWGFHAPGAVLTVLQPYVTDESSNWYQGSADAVHRNIDRLVSPGTAAVVILASDQVYAMDYRELLATHIEADADVTVSVADVPLHEASRYGLVTTDATGRVVRFEEKPERPRSTLASMGIYVFNPDYLARALDADARDEGSAHDFGGDILPRAIADGARVYGHRFRGYWRDIGTIEAYWKSHMELLDEPSRVPLRTPGRAILTRTDPHPPAVIAGSAAVQQAFVSPGVTIRGTVRNSVLSPGVVVEPGALVHDSVLLPGVRVGAGAFVHRAVVDQNAVIGVAARVGDRWFETPDQDVAEPRVTVIGESSWIPDGSVVEPSDVVAPFSGRNAGPPTVTARDDLHGGRATGVERRALTTIPGR